MTSPTLSDALALIDRLILDLARERGLTPAQVRAAVWPESAPRVTETGPGAIGGASVDGSTEPGGQMATWHGGWGWP